MTFDETKRSTRRIMSDEERKEMVMRAESIKVERYNSRLGSLHLSDGVECQVCKNRGWIKELVVIDGWAECLMRKCPNCSEKREKVRNAKDANLGGDYGLKFSEFKTRDQWQAYAKSSALNFVQTIGSDNTAIWIALVGQVGSGKTMLASCVANELLRHGWKVKMKSWPEVVRYTSADYYKEKETLREYQEAQILYLDDLFKGDPTNREISLAYEILNYRYSRRMPTIITSEKTPDELEQVDEALCSRVMEMTSPDGLIVIRKDRSNDQRRKKR